ncbi:hypothetical protein [Tritonibacter mobilis]|uniref:hypothetical protein n=1 Tax=Tritonibacter mobilis TaxID=379347 RepID=UPI001D0D3F47|nr:hypothetical protein [Tritonibacter mobilis]
MAHSLTVGFWGFAASIASERTSAKTANEIPTGWFQNNQSASTTSAARSGTVWRIRKEAINEVRFAGRG